MSSEECMKKIIFALLITAFFTMAFGAQKKEWSAISSVSTVDNSSLSLDWSESGTVALQLFSVNGQMIHSVSRLSISAGTSSVIKVNDLASGVYILEVNNGRAIQTVTIAK